MAPRRKETGKRELTVKLECEQLNQEADRKFFDNVVNSAILSVLGQAAPPYQVELYEQKSMKGTIVMEAEHLTKIWAALTSYGKHFDKSIAFHMFSIKEE